MSANNTQPTKQEADHKAGKGCCGLGKAKSHCPLAGFLCGATRVFCHDREDIRFLGKKTGRRAWSNSQGGPRPRRAGGVEKSRLIFGSNRSRRFCGHNPQRESGGPPMTQGRLSGPNRDLSRRRSVAADKLIARMKIARATKRRRCGERIAGTSLDKGVEIDARSCRPAQSSKKARAVCQTNVFNSTSASCGFVAQRVESAQRRRREVNYATRTQIACPRSRIRLRDLTAIATSVMRRPSLRDFNGNYIVDSLDFS